MDRWMDGWMDGLMDGLINNMYHEWDVLPNNSVTIPTYSFKRISHIQFNETHQSGSTTISSSKLFKLCHHHR